MFQVSVQRGVRDAGLTGEAIDAELVYPQEFADSHLGQGYALRNIMSREHDIDEFGIASWARLKDPGVVAKTPPPPPGSELWAVLEKIFESRGLGIYDVSQMTGIGPPTIYAWRSGAKMKSDKLQTLVTVLSLSELERTALEKAWWATPERGKTPQPRAYVRRRTPLPEAPAVAQRGEEPQLVIMPGSGTFSLRLGAAIGAALQQTGLAIDDALPVAEAFKDAEELLFSLPNYQEILRKAVEISAEARRKDGEPPSLSKILALALSGSLPSGNGVPAPHKPTRG